MYLQILSIVAPIFTLAMVGYIWTKLNYNFPSEFIARIVMNIGAPCLIVSSLTQADIKLGELAHVVSAAMVVLIAMLVLGSLLIRTLKLSASTYLPSLLFPNNGNMGLSICLFTFSELGLALGIGIFMMQTVCQFTLGVFLVNDSARNWHDHLLELGKQPIVYAALFSIACVAWEYQLPAWASNTFQLMGGITIPLMLLTLGVSLAGFRSVQLGYTIWFAVIRLFGGFLLGLAVVEQRVNIARLLESDALFMTNAIQGITAVSFCSLGLDAQKTFLTNPIVDELQLRLKSHAAAMPL